MFCPEIQGSNPRLDFIVLPFHFLNLNIVCSENHLLILLCILMVIFFVKKFQVFKVSLVQSDAEKDSHKLEVEHSKLLIRKMNDKENAAIGANSNFGLSNSMMSSGAPSTGTGGGSSFGNAKYDSLYKMVSGCDREEGMSREELASTLGGKNILMIYTVHLNKYETAPNFILLSQNLTSDCLLI